MLETIIITLTVIGSVNVACFVIAEIAKLLAKRSKPTIKPMAVKRRQPMIHYDYKWVEYK